MLAILSYMGAVVGGAVLYAIGYKSVEMIFEYLKQRGSLLPSKEKINLSGTWYAVWQTTAEGKENINTEVLRIKQKRNKITMENLEKSAENKLGGYLWRAETTLYDNEHIIGHYLPSERNIVSKGTLYFLLNRVGNFMVGKWVGCNYGHNFTWGFGVIAKDKDFALKKMVTLLSIKEGFKNQVIESNRSLIK